MSEPKTVWLMIFLSIMILMFLTMIQLSNNIDKNLIEIKQLLEIRRNNAN